MEKKNEIIYIDPMVDFGFKKIFKDSGKKQLLIRPLTAIFGLDITDIDIRESEQIGLTEQERKVTYDMHCDTRDGQSFIIEVQLADQFIHKFSLLEEQTSELMSRALRFAFMEVARFDKPFEACKTFEDRFLYLMKNLPKFAESPKLWDDMDPYFEELMQEAKFANMSWEEQEKYVASMKQKWDYQNTLDFAEMKGREDVAREMVKDKVPVETIVKYTGLTEEQVRAL